MDKVTWRLVPILIVCFLIAYLDRVNVGFANSTMSKDLALSAAAFGNAAGIFFVGYFFFEVPSNLALNKFGARVWIARIMFTWGIISVRPSWSARQALTLFVFSLALPRLAFFPALSSF
jgi:MFS transporter, ACS family, tartrate transporter